MRRRQPGKRRGPLLPPPPDMARCKRACGRLVWHFDTGCCALCDTAKRSGRRAAGAHPDAIIAADADALYEEMLDDMQRHKDAARA